MPHEKSASILQIGKGLWTVTLVSLQKGDNLPVALFILGYQQFMAKSFKDHYTIESTARAEPDSGSLALQKYT